MPGFSYRVIDSDGKERKGNMNAPTRDQVQKRLVAEGLIIVDVDPIELLEGDSMFGRGRITGRDISEFCFQLSQLLRAGVGTVNALKMISDQTEGRKMSNVVTYLVEQVMNGAQLFEAMQTSEIFSQHLVAAVEAGEQEGCLIDNLELMGRYYDRTDYRNDAIKKSIIYPGFIMLVILMVIAGVLMFVVPGFMGMISGLDIQLSWATRATVAMSNYLTDKLWLLILIAAIVVLIVNWFSRKRTGRLFFSRVRVNYPGMFRRKLYEDMSAFTGLMATLLYSGCPLAKSLELAGNSFMEHVLMRRAILRAKDYVAGGGALSKQMETEGFFPKMFINMVAVGEESGKLKEMFANAAEYYDSKADNSIRRTALVFEPLAVVVLSILLGFIVISLLQPLLALYEAVGSM